MKEHQTSYRQIIQATSLFGGVQIFNIVITIVRSKFIAVLLGPIGMGISGLLTTTTGLITSLTNFGLGTSAVKDISAANSAGDLKRISTVVTSFRRLVWITGSLGTLLTMVLSRWLSKLTFGNENYTLAFIWISITLLLNQLSSGQIVLLQGMRKLKYLAKANMIGSFLGLIMVLPLYYFYNIDGIVPGIIVISLISVSISWIFSRKIKIESVNVSYRQTFIQGKGMLSLGFIISITGMIDLLISYLTRIYISKNGGVDQVGLYSAGFAIINSYVGLIFTAMSTDYYPRLCSLSENNELCKEAINQQAEVAILILAPIIIIFLVFINWVTIILYSTKFVAINEMIHWAILGIFFKAAGWAIGFIFLAKGAAKIYFCTYIIATITILATNILGYKYWALEGLGIAFLISYIIILFPGYFFAKIKFNFSFDSAFLYIFLFQFFLAVSSFVVIKFVSKPYSYFIGIILILLSFYYSYRELDKRINMKSLMVNIRNRFLKGSFNEKR
jgi:O-antigen/teichoic acid export membrane protein